MTTSSALRHAERVSLVAKNGRLVKNRAPETPVAQSWHRCLDTYALDPASRHSTVVLESSQLKQHQERLDYLLHTAKVEMKELYEQIAGSGFAILLTDTDGVIINYVCDPTLDQQFEQAGLWLGADWSEEHEGTNGIGTCIVERRPVTIHRDEHFRSRHIGLTCSAAPICGPHGNPLAVLDASSVNSRDTKQSQLHTRALVNMSASLIENCNFLREYRKAWVLRFHSRPEYVGLLNEAMLALDEDGRILAASHTAVTLLEFDSRKQLVGRAVCEVLEVTPAVLHRNQGSHTVWPMRDIRHGRRFFAMLRGPEKPPRQPTNRSSAVTTPARGLSLQALAGNDAGMAHTLRCALRVIDCEVPIILLGETGTGKEVFARALHAESRRADKPFVAVNCSSIPESLIESELFGYKHGAFTGARREGMRGKVLQSNGGTLFLDEIGDMPAQLQTRLLRVLEEKEVLPLGAETPIPVDLHVISATHRDLDALIAGGDFREDLYYRLSGLTLTLPPLRERNDKAALLRAVAAAENPHAKIEDEAMERLLAYDWPGNIRQLKTVLRTALILSEDQVLRLTHLPVSITQPRKQAPPETSPAPGPKEQMDSQSSTSTDPFENAEREVLLEALYRNCWNVTNTAASLNTSRNTLYRKMKRHGIPLMRPENPCRR